MEISTARIYGIVQDESLPDHFIAACFVGSRCWSIDERSIGCSYKRKYSAEQRMKFYPFNISDSIHLVSFRCHWNNYPINKDGFIKDSLIESKSLNKSDVDKLTDILYNNFYRNHTNYGQSPQCYFEPRNAILFLNKGKLVEYILICFHCGEQEKSTVEINTGDNCSEKFEILRRFFIAKGLKFGTDKDIEKLSRRNAPRRRDSPSSQINSERHKLVQVSSYFIVKFCPYPYLLEKKFTFKFQFN